MRSGFATAIAVLFAQAAAGLGGCAANDAHLRALSCDPRAPNCAPGRDCIDGYCTVRPCTMPSDCGVQYEFQCLSGLCEVVRCAVPADCGAGFSCLGGLCTNGGCMDADRDGYGTGPTCTGAPDCDDSRADVHPGATEGPPGSPTCSDGLDNDCDGQIDAADTGCQNCMTPAMCDDANPCTDDACVASICQNTPNDAFVPDDGVACTADSCMAGIAVHAPQPALCDDRNPCTNDVCSPASGCSNVSDDTLVPPPDGISCTDDRCSGGSPAYVPVDTRCDDANPCTDDSCSVTLDCRNVPNDTNVPPPDAVTCTTEVCSGGAIAHVPDDAACADSNPCTRDSCDPTLGCQNPTDDTLSPPPDGVACTDDACIGGVATYTPVDANCADGNPCTDDRCDATAGCQNPANDALVPPQNSPTDCRRQTCSGGSVVTVSDNTEIPTDGIACTDDTCSGGMPVYTPNDARCSGGQRCLPGVFGAPSGCGAVPSSLTVTCPSTAPSGAVGANCTVTLGGGVTGEGSLINCSSTMGPVSLFRSTFTSCSTAGWTVTGTPACPIDSTAPGDHDALEADAGRCACSSMTWALSRNVNASGLDRLRLCFDYADLFAGNTDRVVVQVTAGGPPVTVFNDGGGPIVGADNIWQTTCIDVTSSVPAAARNPNVGITITVNSNTANHNVYIDNVVLDGWDSTFVTRSTVVQTDFTSCLGAPPTWTSTGTFRCPIEAADPLGGRSAIEVDGATATLTAAIDTTGFCDDIWASFDYAGQNETAGEIATVSFNAGAGLVQLFRDVGGVGPDNTFITFPLDVSVLSAAAAENPALSIQFQLTSTAAGRDLYIDNLVVTGALCGDASSLVTFEPAMDVGGGNYSMQVTSTEQGTAHVLCRWDSMMPPIDGTSTIVFTP